MLRTKHFLVVSLMVETGIKNGFFWVEMGGLLQITDSEVTTKSDLSAVISLLACENGLQGGFAYTVFGYKTYSLAFADGE